MLRHVVGIRSNGIFRCELAPLSPASLIRVGVVRLRLAFESATAREKAMKTKIYLSVLVLVIILSVLNAEAKEVQSKGFQQGTVLSVERQEVLSPNQCCYSGSDAPLQSQYYAFEVSVRVGCGTYVGRYETYIDYLPSAFSPNKEIPVRLTKHVMYFDVPGERDMTMGIVHRSIDHALPCDTGSASR